MFAYSTVTNQWHLAPNHPVPFTATATPILAVNGPTHMQSVTQPFTFWMPVPAFVAGVSGQIRL